MLKPTFIKHIHVIYLTWLWNQLLGTGIRIKWSGQNNWAHQNIYKYLNKINKLSFKFKLCSNNFFVAKINMQIIIFIQAPEDWFVMRVESPAHEKGHWMMKTVSDKHKIDKLKTAFYVKWRHFLFLKKFFFWCILVNKVKWFLLQDNKDGVPQLHYFG